MQKIEKYIYIAIIIILVGFITSLTTYMIMSNNNKPEVKEENKPNENIPNEQITLSEEKLNDLISYVPVRYDKKEFNSYLTNIKLESFSDKELIENALLSIYNNKISLKLENNENNDITDIVISKNEMQNILKQYYNRNIIEFNEQEEYYQIDYNIFTFKNNVFNYIGSRGGDFGEKVGIIDNYELLNNDLIIYEYAADLNQNTLELANLKNQEIMTELNLPEQYEYKDVEKSALSYIKNHKTEFTKYKHTFKKNTTGYYWCSTEAV